MTKRAIVTGASSGIGWETALLLASHHFELVLVARREDRLRDLAALCRERGAIAAHIIAADLTDAKACEGVIAEAVTGGIVSPLCLVNCAGVAESGSITEMPAESLDAHLALNLRAPMLLTRAILPAMLSGGQGQIVNVVSIAATHPFAGAAVYAASKAGLLMFGRCVAAAHRADGIRVTSILPGSTDTALWEGKEWSPPREDMLSAVSVAETIRDVLNLPPDRSIDEIVLTPPKGIL